jgi:phosphate transporter
VNPSSEHNPSPPRPHNTADHPSIRLERGGRVGPPPPRAQLPDAEEFELADYTGIQERENRELQYLEQEARRAEKIRRLDEQDEMKFSHSIQFNAVPDWSSHYIAYSNLKKLYVAPPTAQDSAIC